MGNRPEWFAAKAYGYGSGRPCSWQGWLVMAVYMGLVLGSAYLFGEKPLLLMSIVIPATILLMVVCAKTTRGGWCWRWGSRN